MLVDRAVAHIGGIIIGAANKRILALVTASHGHDESCKEILTIQTDRDTDTDTDGQRDGDRERNRDREKNKDRHRHRHRHRQTERQTQREGQRQTETKIQREMTTKKKMRTRMNVIPDTYCRDQAPSGQPESQRRNDFHPRRQTAPTYAIIMQRQKKVGTISVPMSC
jgi:hypothetical protein